MAVVYFALTGIYTWPTFLAAVLRRQPTAASLRHRHISTDGVLRRPDRGPRHAAST